MPVGLPLDGWLSWVHPAFNQTRSKRLRAWRGKASQCSSSTLARDSSSTSLSQHFLLKLEANLNQGGQQLGGELCRRWGSTSSAPLRLATLYSRDREADGRIDNAILGFQAGCEASEVVIVASVRLSGWTESAARRYMEAMFLADDTINAVLTTSDRHAIGAVTAANVRLPPYRARSLFVNGFGNDEFIRPYLDDDSVFATVDPMINHARKGMWRSLSTALEMASQNGWMTTADVKADVPGMEGFTLLSSSLLIPSDAEGHILSKVLGSAYNSAVRPLPTTASQTSHATVVYVGVHQVVVQEISVPANTFQATFWMKTSWSDTRLEWSYEQFNGTIQVSLTLTLTLTIQVSLTLTLTLTILTLSLSHSLTLSLSRWAMMRFGRQIYLCKTTSPRW